MGGWIELELRCPACWETIAVLVDPGAPRQELVEDCSVCCRPLLLRIELDGEGGARVEARREDAD